MPLGASRSSASTGTARPTPATLFEQVPYLVSAGLFGLGLTISGALIFFSSWLARLIQLPREQAELTRRLLDRTPAPTPTRLIPVADRGS